MKTTITLIIAGSLVFFSVACGDAMNEPITPEARSSQQLNLEGAEFKRVPREVQTCDDCYEVILMRQTADQDGDDDGDDVRFDKRQIDQTPDAFDGDPVPWPLDEKRED